MLVRFMSMTDSNIETIHQNIHQRQSIGQLIEPAPNTQQIEKAVQAALTAPDHHRLKPTRFVVVTPELRAAFGEHLAQALTDLGEADPAQLDRAKQHPFRAPLLVLALTTLQDHPKVPHFETKEKVLCFGGSPACDRVGLADLPGHRSGCSETRILARQGEGHPPRIGRRKVLEHIPALEGRRVDQTRQGGGSHVA